MGAEGGFAGKVVLVMSGSLYQLTQFMGLLIYFPFVA